MNFALFLLFAFGFGSCFWCYLLQGCICIVLSLLGMMKGLMGGGGGGGGEEVETKEKKRK